MFENKKRTAKKGKTKLPTIFIVLRILVVLLLATCITLVVIGSKNDDARFMIPGILGLILCLFLGVISFIPSIQKTSIKTEKYIMETTKDDLKDLLSTTMGIGICATSDAIDGNEDELRNVVDKGSDIASGGIFKTARAFGRGIKESFGGAKGQADAYCKYCGASIDADSVFCKKCGRQQ